MKIIDEPLAHKRKRFNKNKKKAWRTKIDLTDIEDANENVRREERFGGPLADRVSEELFSLDYSKDIKAAPKSRKRKIQDSKDGLKCKTRKGKKLLKCHEYLKGLPGVKAIATKNGVMKQREPQKIRAAKKISVNTLQASLARKKILKTREINKKKKKRTENTDAKEDIWTRNIDELKEFDDVGKTYMEDSLLYHKEQTKTNKVKLPAVHAMGQKSCSIPAVIPPKGGASYNPSFEDHQALLREAVDFEAKKLEVEEKAQRLSKKYIPSKRQGLTQDQVMVEMAEGLPSNSAQNYMDQDEEEDFKGSEGTEDLSCGQRRKEKKSHQARRKAKTVKIKEERRLRKKEWKRQESNVFRVKSYQKAIKKDEEKKNNLEVLKKSERIEKMALPKKLSKYKFEESDVLVPLGTDLSDSLRTIKPMRASLDDAFKNLRRRNLIETKIRVKKSKKKVRMVMKRTKKKEIEEFVESLELKKPL